MDSVLSENAIKDNQIHYMRVQPVPFLLDYRLLLLKLSHRTTHVTPQEQATSLQNMPDKIIINDMILFKNEIEKHFYAKKIKKKF